MKVKSRIVLENAIEQGISYGYSRAFKHNDHPTEDAIKESIHRAILNEIYEWFDFEEEEK